MTGQVSKDQASDQASKEELILNAVRASHNRARIDVLDTIFSSSSAEDVQLAREALRSLMSKGILQLTRDLELSIQNSDTNGHDGHINGVHAGIQ